MERTALITKQEDHKARRCNHGPSTDRRAFLETAWRAFLKKAAAAGPGFARDRSHVEDFLAAIRTGERPHSYIEGGHKSTLMCHLATIAHRTGRALRCDPSDGHIVGDEEAMRLWGRSYAPGWEPTV